ncbi:MAG TPA: phosphoribosylaminoimidazolesuccinocarboxamide synthase [Methanoregulaceae archaeon]|nr:phosphoribosylaminoimidazolesuccinocarboxamide synthase [Methanoregulaceae archaeon]
MKQLGLLYSGKAKSVYRTDQPGELIITFRDDITAFDGGKKDNLREKGHLNLEVSSFFFRLLEKSGIATHYISTLGEDSIVARELKMIPLEVIVRNIAAGSMARTYPIREGTKLVPPVIVMDYKDDSRHDPMLNDDIIRALNIVSEEELGEIKQIALRVNEVLSRYLGSIGIDLVDFKLEFGKKDGSLYVGDEISMDSMRLWDKKTGESLDKDVYRFSKGDVITRYRGAAARITGVQ